MGLLMKTLREKCGHLARATPALSMLIVPILAMAVVVPTTGCGDDAPSTSPFDNTYKMLVHTRNSDGCDSEGVPFDGDDYFKLTESDGTLEYQSCDAADACSGSVNTSKSFAEQDGDRWRNIKVDTNDIRLGCDVILTERTARLDNGDLRIEQRTFEGEIDREEGADCTNELVLSKRGELSCKSYEVVIAVPAE